MCAVKNNLKNADINLICLFVCNCCDIWPIQVRDFVHGKLKVKAMQPTKVEVFIKIRFAKCEYGYTQRHTCSANF